MVFDPNAPQYRTCCCHVKTCATIIGILDAIYWILAFANLVVGKFVNDEEYATESLIAGSIVVAIALLIIVLLFIGLCKENHVFLIPYLICQIIGLVLLALAGVVLILQLTGVIHQDKQREDGRNPVAKWVGSLIVYLIGAAFKIWIFIVVRNCYRYFRDKRNAGYVNAPPMSVAYHA